MALAFDDTWLREPNLLTPRQRPVGSVRVNWDHPLARGLEVVALGWLHGHPLITPRGVLWPLDRGDVQVVPKGMRVADSASSGMYYPVPQPLKAGLTNATLLYRFSPLDVSAATTGFGAHTYPNVNSRFEILSFQDDLYWCCEDPTAMWISQLAFLSAGQSYDAGMRYDGSLSPAGNRLRGYVGRTEYSDIDNFPASLPTDWNRLWWGGYGYGAQHHGQNNISVYGYFWSRTLSTDELFETMSDPYQILEPA